MKKIEFKNVSLKFGDKKVLNDFNLEINEKDKILISGKSGKGKSTLLKILLGFENIDDGKIMIDGKDLEELNMFEIRQIFAYVNQDITFRIGRIKDILKEISKFSGNDFDGEIDSNLMKCFEFDEKLLDKTIYDLSGGERQRLGLIMAIMLNRPVYLLDEITSALDTELKERVAEYFAKTDNTVIAVSHDDVWMKTGNFRKVVL
ncbi:MAG TPA: ABC transporter ATP-binding protein [Anaerovoracaceae bacterium]|nr:ABC transporter ATP-binding protein [Anaerovoracaceae bacterium]